MIAGSSTSCRELSLVEQKRLQWQKEREEMERMGTEMFSHSQTKYERTSIKTYFSNVDLSMNSPQFEEPVKRHFQQFPVAPTNSQYNNAFGVNAYPPAHHMRSMRSPSLPPIPRREDKFYNFPNSQTLIIHPVDTGYHSESSPLNADGPAEVWTNDDDGRASNKTTSYRARTQSTSRPDIECDRRYHPESQINQMTPDIKWAPHRIPHIILIRF